MAREVYFFKSLFGMEKIELKKVTQSEGDGTARNWKTNFL